MTWTFPAPDLVDGPLTGDDRPMLVGYFAWQRSVLANICAGLTADQLVLRPLPSSTLSLLGLVRHLAEVERTWFRRVLAGEVVPLVYSDTGDFQAAYDAREADVAEAFASWRAEVEHSRRIEAAAPDLDLTGHQARWGEDVSLRWVLIHMVEEYARHNGHADLLREGLDGRTGD